MLLTFSKKLCNNIRTTFTNKQSKKNKIHIKNKKLSFTREQKLKNQTPVLFWFYYR